MNRRMLLGVALALVVCAFSYSEALEWNSPLDARTAIEDEKRVVEEAVESATRGNIAGMNALLLSNRGLGARMDRNLLIGRRAVGVCSWLRNQDDYHMAGKVAQRAVETMSKGGEATDEERVERLYWEAVLRGDFLGQKTEALYLLLEAQALAPADDRILETSLQLAQELGEFGERNQKQ